MPFRRPLMSELLNAEREHDREVSRRVGEAIQEARARAALYGTPRLEARATPPAATEKERSVSEDFQVLQSYDELGRAAFDAFYGVLTEHDDGEVLDSGQEEWAEETAKRAVSHFQMGLDGIADPMVVELRGELNRAQKRAQAADARYYELIGRHPELAEAIR